MTEMFIKEMENIDVYDVTDYTLLSRPRTDKRGGGVGMFIANRLNFKKRLKKNYLRIIHMNHYL